MDWITVATWVSIAIALISLLVSIIAMKLGYKAQRESNVIQKRMVEIEEQRENEKRLDLGQAKLRAEIRKPASSNCHRLYVMNEGLAEAKNVQVELDDITLEEHPAYASDSIPNFVGPQSEVSCLLAITLNSNPSFDIKIAWDDDISKKRNYHTTLTL